MRRATRAQGRTRRKITSRASRYRNWAAVTGLNGVSRPNPGSEAPIWGTRSSRMPGSTASNHHLEILRVHQHRAVFGAIELRHQFQQVGSQGPLPGVVQQRERPCNGKIAGAKLVDPIHRRAAAESYVLLHQPQIAVRAKQLGEARTCTPRTRGDGGSLRSMFAHDPEQLADEALRGPVGKA